jgi:adenine C2-methylase RlmN of 23S rRNA A2503 and tRNA A37
MSRTRRVLLQPLPLFDEASLLTAFAECTPPIAGIHATTVWKVLLKHELDQFHPGYIERMNSRMGSRATSRMGSRITSRRPSIGATEEESKEEGGDAERSAAAAASSIASPSNKSALKSKHTITEGDEDQAQEEAAIDTSDAISIASSASFGALPSPSSASSLTASADDLAQFELERQARLKLEAEDDALLMGLNTFPLSKFNPTPEELADESNPLCTKPILPGSIPTVPARLYAVLAEKFSYLTSRLVSHKTSGDGSTTKLLIRLQDGQHIESVIMRHKQKDVATGNVEQRITLCVSSQVGCAMGCTFCATGTMGLRGNLMMGEIVEQLIIANRFEKVSYTGSHVHCAQRRCCWCWTFHGISLRSTDPFSFGHLSRKQLTSLFVSFCFQIRNIVFMGMGEPLKNYEQVLSAIRAMTDGNRFGLAPSRITLSTVGVIPKMLELTRDIPAIQLALSLHAPTQELRQKIVPTAKAWPIEKLIEAADYFIQRSKKRILMEYVLLDGVNASEKEAHELGKLLQGKDVVSTRTYVSRSSLIFSLPDDA